MDWKNIKETVKGKAVETKTKLHVWYINNEEKILMAAPIIIPATVGIVRAVSKSYNAHLDEHHRKLTQYDPATGYYNQLRRELKPSDWDRILNMKRVEGITLTECLIRLNLVK